MLDAPTIALADPSLHPDEAKGTQGYSGVTRTLSSAGIISDYQVAEDVLERGNEVHLACKYFDEHDLDRRTLPHDRKMYVDAWAKFRRENSFQPLLIEHHVENHQHQIRGRLDRFGTIAGQKAVPHAIIEIATGHALPFKRLQTAIYGWMHDPSKVFRRIAVELRAAGTYNCIEYELADYFSDVHTFLACIRVTEFKRRFRL